MRKGAIISACVFACLGAGLLACWVFKKEYGTREETSGSSKATKAPACRPSAPPGHAESATLYNTTNRVANSIVDQAESARLFSFNMSELLAELEHLGAQPQTIPDGLYHLVLQCLEMQLSARGRNGKYDWAN